MLLHPGSNLGCFMSTVIIQNQMERCFTGEIPIQTAEELQKLLMSMSCRALANNLSLHQLQRRKQRSRAVPFVIMRHRATAPFFPGQPWLGSVQRLNLALLIDAEYD